MDRRSLAQLCGGALSAEEVARPLMDSCGFRDDLEEMQGDWNWICLVCLWQRWWPDKGAWSFWTTRSRPATASSSTTKPRAPPPDWILHLLLTGPAGRQRRRRTRRGIDVGCQAAEGVISYLREQQIILIFDPASGTLHAGTGEATPTITLTAS